MRNDKLIFKKAANSFLEATPLGNGRIGAIVFGEPNRERIVFNEDTLWSGFKRNTRKDDAHLYLQEVRRLLAEGKNDKAHNLIEQHMLGNGYSESYMPFCELNLEFSDHSEISDYCRSLSMTNGIAEVSYKAEKGRFYERAFVSFPDEVFVLNCALGGEDVHVTASSLLKYEVFYENSNITLKGICPDRVAPEYLGEVENSVDYSMGRGLHLCFKGHIETDGIVIAENSGITISGARYLNIICALHNTFDTEKPESACGADIKKAFEKGGDLLSRHTKDFSALYNRVSLRLKEDFTEEYFIDELLFENSESGFSPALTEAIFHFGRYLAISSSRQGQPGNLQGIWNWLIRPPWSSNWTTNINIQMNYWPIETCNLSELFTPLENWVRRLLPSGRKTASSYYNSDGWCIHHNVDVWGITTPAMDEAHYAMWPMAGVWICQHLYRHWQYTRDIDYLKNSFLPVCKGAVRFCLDMLVEDEDGFLVTSPSTSPENIFLFGPLQKEVAVTRGSAMDMTLVDEIFGEYILACKMVGISDDDLTEKATAAKQRLKPFTKDKNGCLAEWGTPFEENDSGHRHFSPLYGVYPGETLLQNEDVFKASEKLFFRRISHNGCIGWSYAWAVCLAARYGECDLAEEMLKKLQAFSFSYNLFSVYYESEMFEESRHNNNSAFDSSEEGFFQIDANFGFTAAVAELLLKSTDSGIELLPCLLFCWPDGEISGFRAYGDITVDISWKEGKMVSTDIKTGKNCDEEITVIYKETSVKLRVEPEKQYRFLYSDGKLLPYSVALENHSADKVLIGKTI